MSKSDEELARLTQAATELMENVQALNRESGEQFVNLSRTAKFNRRMIWGLTVSFGLDILLTILITAGLISLNDVTKRVDETQATQKAQVLCPLYELFIASDTPEVRERLRQSGQTEEALRNRTEQFKIIRHSYSVLECSKGTEAP